MANVPFTSNYTDLSSQRGFQFKFFCEKCGNGYLSSFQTNRLGTAAAAMDAEFGPEIPDSWAAALADAGANAAAQDGALTVASGADPAERPNPIVEAGLLDIVAASDSPGDSVANPNGLLANAGQPAGDGSQPAADRVAEITARAEGITAKSEELTARAEDLTGRIESLTAKIEELETKLAARPAAVPSPVEASDS